MSAREPTLRSGRPSSLGSASGATAGAGAGVGAVAGIDGAGGAAGPAAWWAVVVVRAGRSPASERTAAAAAMIARVAMNNLGRSASVSGRFRRPRSASITTAPPTGPPGVLPVVAATLAQPAGAAHDVVVRVTRGGLHPHPRFLAALGPGSVAGAGAVAVAVPARVVAGAGVAVLVGVTVASARRRDLAGQARGAVA